MCLFMCLFIYLLHPHYPHTRFNLFQIHCVNNWFIIPIIPRSSIGPSTKDVFTHQLATNDDILMGALTGQGLWIESPRGSMKGHQSML